jgi:hypothetical protein
VKRTVPDVENGLGAFHAPYKNPVLKSFERSEDNAPVAEIPGGASRFEVA